MKKLLCLLLLATGSAFAAGPAFDAGSSVLTLPTLTVGADTFTNVKVKLGSVEVLAIDPLAPSVAAETVCTDANFTKEIADKLWALKGKAVTLKQLEGIIGCSSTSIIDNAASPGASYGWRSTGPKGTIFSLGTTGGILDNMGMPIFF